MKACALDISGQSYQQARRQGFVLFILVSFSARVGMLLLRHYV